MDNEQRRQEYINIKSQLLSIYTQIDSLNKDYNTLTSYLEKGLKIDGKIMNFDDWNSIGNNQKDILNNTNQVILPIINRNINS